MRQKVSGWRARRRRRMVKMLQLAAAGAAAMEYERNLLVASSAECAAAIQQLPKERDTRKPRRRLNWDNHARECVEQGTFTRMYRMTLNCFNKLVSILRPLLERDVKFGGKYSTLLYISPRFELDSNI